MGNDLVKRKCTACVSGVTPLKGEALRPFFMQLGKGWEIMFEHHLEKTFTFKNFQKALDFAMQNMFSLKQVLDWARGYSRKIWIFKCHRHSHTQQQQNIGRAKRLARCCARV